MKTENVAKANPMLIAELMSAMNTYLIETKRRDFYDKSTLAYCNSCKSLTKVGETSYIAQDSPKSCFLCGDLDFVEFSIKDSSKLKSIYGKKVYELLIKGIEKGLLRINELASYNIFPLFYRNPDDRELLEIAGRWEKLKNEDKKKQINALFELNKKILKSKKRLEILESIVIY
ncbi:MAG: hypothetical protein Q8N63_01360 [Nanoarchaeota archaeon]|nr:hypothetical protein [Nanoarchaeota archaeon]